MKYTVTWSLFAETQLADIWVRAFDKQAVTNASDEIDRQLKIDADRVGVPDLQGWRIIVVPPLAATFDVSVPDRLVTVLSIRYRT
jgi:hypothetical protein